LPKPLVPIGDEFAILEIVLRQLAHHQFETATIAIGHLGHLIRAYVGDGSRWGLSVDYTTEEQPLGTIGPLLTILDRLPEQFLVMNGDILCDLPYGNLLDAHSSADCGLTVATYARTVKIDFGVLEPVDGRIARFIEKPEIDYRVSMGVYAMSKAALSDYEAGQALGFDRLVLDLIEAGRNPAVYEFSGYWLDIGRPDDYDQANAEFPAMRARLLPDV
jgi:mannose-1-phosphate guanylyltransferase